MAGAASTSLPEGVGEQRETRAPLQRSNVQFGPRKAPSPRWPGRQMVRGGRINEKMDGIQNQEVLGFRV